MHKLQDIFLLVTKKVKVMMTKQLTATSWEVKKRKTYQFVYEEVSVWKVRENIMIVL